MINDVFFDINYFVMKHILKRLPHATVGRLIMLADTAAVHNQGGRLPESLKNIGTPRQIKAMLDTDILERDAEGNYIVRLERLSGNFRQ